MTNKYIQTKIFRLAWLFAIIGALLPCRAQSTAETAEGIKRELDGIKTEFVSTLQSAVSNPENLQSGQTKANCERILAKLESLQSTLNSTTDLLAKRETDLNGKAGLSEADKLELKQTLQTQRKPLEAHRKMATQLEAELKSLNASKITAIKEIYKSYLDVAGPEQAKAKVAASIQPLLAPHLPSKPKSTPSPYVAPKPTLAIQPSLTGPYEPTPLSSTKDRNLPPKPKPISTPDSSPKPAMFIKDDMVQVEGGTLPKASELSGKRVKSFYIGRTEVTWLEWKKVRGWAAEHGYDIGNVGAGSGNEHPVRDVNWYDCVKWCNARSEMQGLMPVYQVKGAVYRSGDYGDYGAKVVKQLLGAKGYRLPSWVEWEWAARGGVRSLGYKHSGSDDLNAVGWYDENSKGATHAVGDKAANELGLYDMNGNVSEWCWDRKGANPFQLGGSWNNGGYLCTVSFPNRDYPGARFYNIGLRLARSSEF
jgi:formylglycine-generating enzyme required for sulfatase activity